MTVSRKPHTIWNLGLPRTGTTSVSAALKGMGYHCVAVGAQWQLQGQLPLQWPTQHPPLICTMRCLDEWLPSAQKYMRRKTAEELKAMWFHHRDWVADLRQEVGYLDVLRGYSGLFRALSVAVPHKYLPHLNAGSSIEPT